MGSGRGGSPAGRGAPNPSRGGAARGSQQYESERGEAAPRGGARWPRAAEAQELGGGANQFFKLKEFTAILSWSVAAARSSEPSKSNLARSVKHFGKICKTKAIEKCNGIHQMSKEVAQDRQEQQRRRSWGGPKSPEPGEANYHPENIAPESKELSVA
ncbi:hypothetical protein NA56DRAFT_707831 [Hyaloscypha hepaticicola]|uniref:Uncharacterized protein n=1 Tax=Hyaloscypha hepaticicola TaxID=2082293 RepID=A0A2J6PTG1_9HELO|nr:hypothetical protein NA56DRAFT_707831 [Hyaloscypha hepaticicola]